MHRSPGLLVLLISRVQQQSGYEPEPRNWTAAGYELHREQALVAKYTALETLWLTWLTVSKLMLS